MIDLLISVVCLLVLIVLLLAAIWLDIYTGIRLNRPLLPPAVTMHSTNQLHYFSEGHALFADMQQVIEQATQRVSISFFIFETDPVGMNWLNLLEKKARQGVTVRLLVDFLNSRPLRPHLARLRAAGVVVAFSGKPRFPFTFYYLNRRNHRKLLIVDGQIGYFGGFNVGMAYLGNDPLMGNWHDNHLRVDGDGAAQLEQIFAADWHRATGSRFTLTTAAYPNNGGSALDLVATNANQAETLLVNYFRSAHTSIIICSPYFVPSRKLFNVLLECLADGIRLSILVPMKADHALVKPAAFHYLAPLVEKGAHLYQFHQGFYHAKIFIVDQKRFYIGSANFDQRSLFWNDEVFGFCDDCSLARQLVDQFEHESAEQSSELTKTDVSNRSWLERVQTICTLPFHFFL